MLPVRAVRQAAEFAPQILQFLLFQINELTGSAQLFLYFGQLLAVCIDHMLIGDDVGVQKKKARALTPWGNDVNGGITGTLDAVAVGPGRKLHGLRRALARHCRICLA